MGLGNFKFAAETRPGSRMCINIFINDDELVERTERFIVCLNSTQTSVDSSCTVVHIEDNDRKIGNASNPSPYLCMTMYISNMIDSAITVAVLQFSQPSYNVREDSGVVSVCLQLVNGTLTEDINFEATEITTDKMATCK